MPSYTICKKCRKKIQYDKRRLAEWCRACWLIVGIKQTKRGQLSEEGRERLRQAVIIRNKNWRAERSPMWKGGKIEKRGYIYVYCGRKNYIAEHRLVMEKKLNRKLENNEIVHHVNGIKNDNRIENLIVITCSQHMTNHVRKWKRNKKGKFVASL